LTDSGGLSDTQDITVTLSSQNDPPAFTSTPVTSATEDNVYTYNVTATDVDVGDTLSISGTPAWLSLTDNGDGTATLTGTPDNDDVGDHAVELTVTDSAGATDTQSFSITVSNTNDAPVITSTPVTTVDEDDTYTYTLMASDVDVGDELTLSAPTLPSWLSFAPETGTLSGTPTNDDVGDHHMVLRVNDGTVDVDQGFTITVSNTNDPPTISGTPATSVDEDTAYSFTPTANDVDVGDTLIFSIENKPSWASFDTNTGALSGTPINEDVGTTAGIVITVEDTSTVSASLPAFNLTVVNVNTDLEIQKNVDNMTPNVGDNVVFTISVTNNDPSDATGIEVTDILPSGLNFVSDDSEGGYDPDTGIWYVGNLSANAPNNTASLNITAKVIQEGEIVNIGSIINSEQTDLDGSNNSSGLILNAANQADLAIEKTIDNPTSNIGDTITFTIRVRNNGLDDATGVQVTEQLPPGLTYVDDDSEGSYDPGTGVWDVGILNVGDIATLQLTVTVNNTDEIINTASITHSDQIDPDTTNNESGEIINQDTINHPSIADLAIQKTVNQSEVNVGDEVVFIVLVRNNGPDDANSVQIDDVLSYGVTFISSKPSKGTYNEATGVWDIGAISAASYVLMDMVAEVADGGPQTNVASVGNVDEFDPNNGDDSAEVTVTGQAADVSVEKIVDNEEPRVGDNVIFTITVTNSGPNDATGIQIADQLPAGLSYKRDDSGGSYNPGTGVWDVGDLANGASATVQITARVDQPGDDITNTAARADSSPPDTNSDNDIGSVIINVPYDGDGDGMPDEWEVNYGLDPWIDDSVQDPDEDGLSNLGECQNGTDPNRFDTDNDGMPDEWEVNYGIDPLDSVGDNGAGGDFDNDGWTNYEEYINGTNPADDNSPVPTPPEIIEAIPHNNAGIDDDTRVCNDTSFAVRIEDSDGVDITDTSSIKFTIDDGINPAYEWDLSDTAVVRVVKLTSDDDTEVTKLWVVYDRSKEAAYGSYSYDRSVNIKVDAKDIRGDWMTQASYDFKIETETEHNEAQANLPDSGPVDPDDQDLGGAYDAGSQVNSGDIEGAKIIYDSSEPVTPRFGPMNELPPLGLTEVEAVGMPMNLEPPTAFNTPVKVFIPCPDYTDVSSLCVYLYNGTSWVLACDTSGNVQPGGAGCIVPESRVNHNDCIEVQLYHFSGVQAAVSENQLPSASFVAEPLSGTAPLRVIFDATASNDHDGTINSYAWDFGDGSTGSGETISHEFVSAGTYTVTLTVTDDVGATDTATTTITVTETTTAPGGEPSGCFIATAAYGSPINPYVLMLCEFHDRMLLTNFVGAAFVNLYHPYSPPVAEFIANHDTVRLVVRWSLLPLVGASWITLKLGPRVTLALVMLPLLLMITTAVVALRRSRLKRCQT